MTKIIQWNCRSYRAQVDHLKILINSQNPSIITLQETRFKHNNVKDISNFKMFHKSRNEAVGGVAIYVKESLFAEQKIIQSHL